MILYEEALALDSEEAGAGECTQLSMTCLAVVAMMVIIPRHPQDPDMILLDLEGLHLVVDEDHLDAARAEGLAGLAGLAVTSFKRAASHATLHSSAHTMSKIE